MILGARGALLRFNAPPPLRGINAGVSRTIHVIIDKKNRTIGGKRCLRRRHQGSRVIRPAVELADQAMPACFDPVKTRGVVMCVETGDLSLKNVKHQKTTGRMTLPR